MQGFLKNANLRGVWSTQLNQGCFGLFFPLLHLSFNLFLK